MSLTKIVARLAILSLFAGGRRPDRSGSRSQANHPDREEVRVQPARIELKVGEPVEIVFESEDTKHGFECKELGLEKVVFDKGEPQTVGSRRTRRERMYSMRQVLWPRPREDEGRDRRLGVRAQAARRPQEEMAPVGPIHGRRLSVYRKHAHELPVALAQYQEQEPAPAATLPRWRTARRRSCPGNLPPPAPRSGSRGRYP